MYKDTYSKLWRKSFTYTIHTAIIAQLVKLCTTSQETLGSSPGENFFIIFINNSQTSGNNKKVYIII